jgi:hypothetical protein
LFETFSFAFVGKLCSERFAVEGRVGGHVLLDQPVRGRECSEALDGSVLTFRQFCVHAIASATFIEKKILFLEIVIVEAA